MTERIKQIIEQMGMTPSAFADEIGLKRTIMSHILNGRNNPSLDVVQKITDRFKEIDVNWLLKGVGTMVASDTNSMSQAATKNEGLQGDLFSAYPTENPIKSNETESVAKNDTHSASSSPSKSDKIAENKEVMSNHSLSDKPLRRVSKIIIYYSDNTFETFCPDAHNGQAR